MKLKWALNIQSDTFASGSSLLTYIVYVEVIMYTVL